MERRWILFSPTPTSADLQDDGVTVLELLVVLMVLAMLGGVVGSRAIRDPTVDDRAYARLESLVRRVQIAAIARGQAEVVHVEAGRAFWGDRSASWDPRTTSVELAGKENGEPPERLVIYPDGSMSGSLIVVSDGISVDELSWIDRGIFASAAAGV